MERKTVSGITVTLLLVSMVTLAFSIQPAKADWTWTETIHIRADGSVKPDTAPILTVDNITYTFTDNIVGDVPLGSSAIVVERDNIVVDGAGYTLQGTGDGEGINMTLRSNVTIKDIEIKGFDFGIRFINASNNGVFGNSLIDNSHGINLFYHSNYNNISRNYVTNNYHGISVSDSTNNSICGNDITANDKYGIQLDGASQKNSLWENNITNNEVGIDLSWSCNNNNLYRNDITANSEQGIMIYLSSNNTLRDNSIAGSMYNFGVWGWEHSHLVNDVDSSNTVDNKPIIYWINKQNMVVPIEAGYVALVKCRNITVRNLNLTNNLLGALLANTTNSIVTKNNVTANKWRGIEVIGSSNNSISGNNVANNKEGILLSHSSNHNSISENNVTRNKWGIELDHSSNNTVYGNNITNNDYGVSIFHSSNNSIFENDVEANNIDGIRLGTASNNTIFGNTVAYNLYGIYFPFSSSDNVIYHNNFVNNTNQLDWTSDSMNAWDNGTEGNYWSDYEESHPDAKELNDSGIWDTPYVIDEHNQDRYPLMDPTWGPKPTATEVPFWMQWWFWAIVVAGIIALAGTVYFLKRRKPPTPTTPTPSEGTVIISV
jgi:parallel beta-helix repeat protein